MAWSKLTSHKGEPCQCAFGNGAAIWVAIEASGSLNENDVRRARENADALAVMFDQPTEAAVVGHRIGVLDEERADAARVHMLLVAPGL